MGRWEAEGGHLFLRGCPQGADHPGPSHNWGCSSSRLRPLVWLQGWATADGGGSVGCLRAQFGQKEGATHPSRKSGGTGYSLKQGVRGGTSAPLAQTPEFCSASGHSVLIAIPWGGGCSPGGHSEPACRAQAGLSSLRCPRGVFRCLPP